MTILSIYLDELGFFSYLANKTLERAGKSQLKLFLYLYLIVSLLTVFTSNDIIILSFKKKKPEKDGFRLNKHQFSKTDVFSHHPAGSNAAQAGLGNGLQNNLCGQGCGGQKQNNTQYGMVWKSYLFHKMSLVRKMVICTERFICGDTRASCKFNCDSVCTNRFRRPNQ